MLATFLLCAAFGTSQAQAPGCPQITCVMFCANGVQKDANGCNMCSCAEVPGSGMASFDCSKAPGWGWCAAYSQCVNPAVNPCPGGITSTPGSVGGGVLPNPSVHTTTAAAGTQISVALPADLPAQLAPGQVDAHGCPPNYPWCAQIGSCSMPSACGDTNVANAVAKGGFSMTASAGFAAPAATSVTGRLSVSNAFVPAPVQVSPVANQCSKKSCKSCRAQSGCYWNLAGTGGQCSSFCRPGACLTLGQTCPAKPKKSS